MSNANGVNTLTTSDPVMIMITHLHKTEVSETVLVEPPKLFGPSLENFKF